MIIPNTGDLVGTWGSAAINPDLSAADGYFGGVQTITVSNAPITLTAPAGFTPTPSGGPTQAQNATLRFTGTLTAGVQITLPLPGFYIIEHIATGNFVLSFRALGSGEVIGFPPGEIQHIYNDGTNVRFVNLGRIGHSEIWAGLSAIPSWVTACSKKPYLLNDATVYNVSDYPFLGAQLLGKFGGNGVTTFAVPDSQGRMQLPYDGTGTRITTAGCGLNGQVIGASLDEQAFTLTTAQIPSGLTVSVSGSISGNATPTSGGFVLGNGPASAVAGGAAGALQDPINFESSVPVTGTFSGSGTASGGGGSHPNVQPSQVTGISVIRAA